MLQTCMGRRDPAASSATPGGTGGGTATTASLSKGMGGSTAHLADAYNVNSVGYGGGNGIVTSAPGGIAGAPNTDAFAAAKKAEELREALADVLPEDIPGIPRHRPELSPTR